MELAFSSVLIVSLVLFLLLGRMQALKPWSGALLNSSFFLIIFSGISNVSLQSFPHRKLFTTAFSIIIGLAVATSLIIMRKSFLDEQDPFTGEERGKSGKNKH